MERKRVAIFMFAVDKTMVNGEQLAALNEVGIKGTVIAASILILSALLGEISLYYNKKYLLLIYAIITNALSIITQMERIQLH
eukprot:snap_masked-scaffold_2-processed-gene-24.30-mRNA-1 protein AED:1.00 eAED:1.00 QI:0/0/0/0/1/1/3/0/82